MVSAKWLECNVLFVVVPVSDDIVVSVVVVVVIIVAQNQVSNSWDIAVVVVIGDVFVFCRIVLHYFLVIQFVSVLTTGSVEFVWMSRWLVMMMVVDGDGRWVRVKVTHN